MGDAFFCSCPVLPHQNLYWATALMTLLFRPSLTPPLSQVPCQWWRTFSWNMRQSAIERHCSLLTSILPRQFQHQAAFFTSCPNCCAALLGAVKQLPPSTPDMNAIQGQVKIFLPSHKLMEETSGGNYASGMLKAVTKQDYKVKSYRFLLLMGVGKHRKNIGNLNL